ncbi:MAG: hypothetical protein ACXQTU_01700 [Candidatus Nezhaarchaeales archaeon]
MYRFDRLLGLMGLVLGVLGIVSSIYLFLKEASLISLSRDIIGSVVSSPADKELVFNWLNILASSWSFSIICFFAFSLILTAFSAALLITSFKVSKT